MDIYLPIAEVSVNWPTLVILGAVVGFVSGLFGIGGGFLMAPILVFLGIPPTVAVASQASHVVASSTSGVIRYAGAGSVDFKMGSVMAAGGAAGALAGVELFRYLRLLGQADLVVALSYLVFLGAIGILMLNESLTEILRRRRGLPAPHKQRRRPMWLYGLPLKMKFRASGLYISVIPPILVGALVGFLAAIMGVGGGFIMVPAMIYLLGMPTKVVIGTSLFQIIFTTAFTTLMHAVSSQTVDILLAVLLILGGVIGAQLGARVGVRLRADHLRVLLALLVLAVCLRVAADLLLTPEDFYSITPGRLP